MLAIVEAQNAPRESGDPMSMTLSAAREEPSSRKQPRRDFQPDDLPLTLNDHLRALQPYSARRHFSRNETIFSEGDPADTVYKIISGTVRICRHTSDGRRHIADFAMPGDLLGFLECADQPATAEAVTEVTLIAYPRTRFDRLAESSPAVRSQVLCHLSASLLEARHHLFVLGCQCAKERVASFLLRLADRTDVMPGERLDLPMGRQDIADHLGLTVETVCRAISALRGEGLVTVPNSHQLILNDIEALRVLAVEA
jgi:CRP/FNR family transcriptional regulator, nitrogen fixation regulation protein